MRYNQETKYYQVRVGDVWYNDRYFNPLFDGYIYNLGHYLSEYFTTDWKHNGYTGTAQRTNSNQTNFELNHNSWAGQAAWTYGEFVMDLPYKVLEPSKITITYTLSGNTDGGGDYGCVFGVKSSNKISNGSSITESVVTASLKGKTSVTITIPDSCVGTNIWFGFLLSTYGSNTGFYSNLKINTIKIDKVQ